MPYVQSQPVLPVASDCEPCLRHHRPHAASPAASDGVEALLRSSRRGDADRRALASKLRLCARVVVRNGSQLGMQPFWITVTVCRPLSAPC